MERATHPDLPSLIGTRVLVVEDEFLLLLELERILSEAGAKIVGLCRTTEQAHRHLRRDELHVAVLDFQLFRETSESVAHELSRRGTPFVFYTGQAGTDLISSQWPRCKIISKPGQPEKLVAAVASLISEAQPKETASAFLD